MAGLRYEAMQEIGSDRVEEARLLFLNASRADKKGGQHSTGVRYWLIYMVYGLGLSPIQDPRDTSWETAVRYEDHLEGMAVWIATERPYGRQVSHASISKYVSSIRAWYHRFYRGTLGLGAEGSRIRDVLDGYAREVEQPPPRERVGCTPAHLSTALAALRPGHMWRSATTFAMAVLARGCEVALDSSRGETFDATQHMTVEDVEFFCDARGVEHARIRMRKRKDLRVLRGKQAVVYLSGGHGGFFDSVSELRAWIDLRRAAGIADDRPLFCHMDGSAITVSQLRDIVKELMSVVGLDPNVYGAHSLRIGGATAALAAGVQPALIRLMGRWSSDIYEIYCRMSQESALSVGAAIASALVTPASPSFTREALELQPQEAAVVGRYMRVPTEGETSDAWGAD